MENYIKNKIGDILCRDKNGKERYMPPHIVEKGLVYPSYLKGLAPVGNSNRVEDIAKELKDLNNTLGVIDAVEGSEVEGKTDSSLNYNTTNAANIMKSMDVNMLEKFVEGDERKTIVKLLKELI